MDEKVARRLVRALPNLMTGLRLAAVPWITVLALDKAYGLLFVVFALTALTDALDGALARRLDAQTEWGRVLDPLADKAAYLAAATVLTVQEGYPLWLLAGALMREAAILIACATALLRGDPMGSPQRPGKIYMLAQYGLISFILAGSAFDSRILGMTTFFSLMVAGAGAVSLACYAMGWRRATPPSAS